MRNYQFKLSIKIMGGISYEIIKTCKKIFNRTSYD